MLLIDPSESPDPTVREVVARRQLLVQEAEYLKGVLATYTDVRFSPIVQHAAIPPLEHYSMMESSACGCLTCSEWALRRQEFVAVSKFVPKGHKWSTCSCSTCRFVGRIQLNFLAATNRRDLLIETSYHAEHHSQYGSLVMGWLEQELKLPCYTINWCAQEMSRYPLEWWLRRCEAALSPVVSGVVFKTGVLVSGLHVHFASSLTSMGEVVF